MKKIFFLLFLSCFIFILNGCDKNVSDKTDELEKENWKVAYENFISSSCIENNTSSKSYIYIYDFDDDEIPELIYGNESLGIYSYQEDMVKKLFEIDYGNTIYFKNNSVICVSNGSDGNEYVCVTYVQNKYMLGHYSEYVPTEATINNEQVPYEYFCRYFDLYNYSDGRRLYRHDIHCNQKDVFVKITEGTSQYGASEKITTFNWEHVLLEVEPYSNSNEIKFIFLEKGNIVNWEKGGLLAYYKLGTENGYQLVYFQEKENDCNVMEYTTDDISFEFEKIDTKSEGIFNKIKLLIIEDCNDDALNEIIVVGEYLNNEIIHYESRVFVGKSETYEFAKTISSKFDEVINSQNELLEKTARDSLVQEIEKLFIKEYEHTEYK